MKKLNLITGLGIVLFAFNCSSKEDDSVQPTDKSMSETWLIPEERVLDGGPGKDGIPAINDPKFDKASATTYLSDEDIVIGFKHDGIIKAYPHLILDWHEIVNDEINNSAFAITYCPLTGTAINWNRTFNGVTTTFGVSGLLYNSNLIPYDRETDSNWSQMQLKCVNGELIGTEASTFQLVETSWKSWKEMYEDSEVMTTQTGFARNYGSYPYIGRNGDYREESYLIFPVENSDNRLDAKERVHGVIEGEEVRVFRFEEFENELNIIEDNLGGQNIAVIGSKQDNYIVSFIINDEELRVNRSGEAVFKDQNDNVYNIFGEIIEGPDTGNKLASTQSFIGYWFSWAAFYPEVDIYNFN